MTNSVYLDHAATTPLSPAAAQAMARAYAQTGNASALHGSGRAARRTLEEGREAIASALGAHPTELLFTSGGTESDNLAVQGVFFARRAADAARTRIIASPIEHHAVLDTVQWLAKEHGAQISWLPVDALGLVRPADLRAELAAHGAETALVTVMWANNEVGAIEPIAELAAIAAEYGVPMHSDAVQAAGHLPVDFAASGLSAMSVAAHKFGGPVGVGALAITRGTACQPLLHGGGQEREIRSGTYNVAGVAGMAAALTATDVPAESARLAALRDRLIAAVEGLDGTAVLNGPRGSARLAGNAHFTFPGALGDSLLMLLDAQGIEASTGSACNAGVTRPSHVLTAMGADAAAARGSLRFTLGRTSTQDDVDALAAALPQVLARARAAFHPSSSAKGR
jgi:cysteine desulfurase